MALLGGEPITCERGKMLQRGFCLQKEIFWSQSHLSVPKRKAVVDQKDISVDRIQHWCCGDEASCPTAT